MHPTIVAISDRGQITLPKAFRTAMAVKHFVVEKQEEGILLKPLQTREEFFDELENTYQDWKKKGGLTVKEMKKKYKL